MTRSTPFDRRALRESIAVGLALALVAMVAGVALALAQHQTWTAESVLVVLPQATLDTADSAAYYETLSRGQIVATFAEVAGNLRFEQQAEDGLQLSEAQRKTTSTEVSVVPDTSVILVRATARDARTAEGLADGTTAVASQYLAGLSKPYRTDTVKAATGSAYASGTSPLLLAVAALVVALVAGLAVQQAVYHLALAIRRSPDPTVGEGAVVPDPIATPDRADPVEGGVTSVTAPAAVNGSAVNGRRTDKAEKAGQNGTAGGWWS